jgi:uncharacterized membrane protein
MRYNLIDFVRGTAFLLMLIHHYFHFNPNIVSMPEIVNILGTVSRTIFIILVGISMRLFKTKTKKLSLLDKIAFNGPYKKSYLILLSALIITFATYLFLPNNEIIFFGVLHFIAIATFIMKEFSSDISITILIGIISLIMSNYMITKRGSNNILHLILGGYTQTRFPIDIFPIFQWLPYVSFGIILGEYINKYNIDYGVIYEPIEFCGRNSLYLYILHVIPCIYWFSRKYKN